MGRGKYTYSTFACIFVILIVLANFGREIAADFGGNAYRRDPVFPPDRIIGGDFYCYLYMALRVRHGLPLYEERDYTDQRQVKLDEHYRKMLGSLPDEDKEWIVRVQPLPWNHTPFAACLFVPLTFLTHPWAYRAYLGLLIAALFLSLALLGGYSRHKAHYWTISAALVAFSYPLRFQLERGTSEPFVLLLVTAAFVLWRSRWDAAGVGALIAIAAHLKIYPVIFLCYFILKREWRICLWIVVFILVLVLASALISREGPAAGIVQYGKLYRFVKDVYLTEDTWVFAGNHSTYSFIGYLLLGSGISAASLLRLSNAVNLVLLACLSISIVARNGRGTFSTLMEFALVMTVMTVISPAANDYSLVPLYFVFAACAIAFEGLDFRAWQTRTLFLIFSLSAALIFLSFLKMPIAAGPSGGYLRRLWFLSNKWPLLMLLGGTVWLVRQALLVRPGTPRPPYGP